ncbi:hypothetical protein IQ07DRAFT_529398 [Pyrenochaeta sp. DS3sAY3a]|nr:hypothetical protein IQ07DRAFT_529398 [Pyrenochaeta sp. DS3sAY3a]
MAIPYQCLASRAVGAASPSGWTIFGASGPNLVVQSSQGTTAVWPTHDEAGRGAQEDGSSPQEPPGKRIKLDQPKEQKANFSDLIISADGQHLVGATGEDKCIRVFQIDAQNQLHQLSERCMSRRPCSITLTDDDSTILCADKFGDVYALPLLPSPEEEHLDTPETEQLEQHDYAPAATVLTVHSGRNRKTLEEQLKQKAKGKVKSKEPMTFKHELLLGHVSMLTDIAFAKVNGRSYIITADRDEHIRVSRGQPQAHIIEGFCFGHEAFVSRLCLTTSGLLVSGGGDDALFVWDWQAYRMIERISIRDTISRHLESRSELGSNGGANLRIAVSGIWNVPQNKDKADEILVGCEGLSLLLSIRIGQGQTGVAAIPLNGNVLDVAFIELSSGSCTAVVSVDNMHKPNSTTEVRVDNDVPRLQCLTSAQGAQWQEDLKAQDALQWFTQQGHVERRGGGETASGNGSGSGLGSAADKAGRDMLYHVENLRKRPGADD